MALRLFDNILYKVVALLIAGVLWAAAQGVRDAEQRISLPIKVEDVPEDLVVVDQSVHEIALVLQGSRASLQQANQDLTRYVVSLRDVKEGEARIAVNTERLPDLPRGANVITHVPDVLVFKAERVSSKVVRVRADVAGEPPEGYRWQVDVDPPRVELEGARSSVRRVREVLTEPIDVTDLRESTTFERRVLVNAPNVWRKDGNGDPIKVVLTIEAPPQEQEEPAESPTG